MLEHDLDADPEAVAEELAKKLAIQIMPARADERGIEPEKEDSSVAHREMAG
jgi:GAF domain-containing protein